MLPVTFVSGAGIVFVPLSAVTVRSCAFSLLYEAPGKGRRSQLIRRGSG